ncbi:MAG: YfiR family protein [candidate division Zixibacteria bacterium]|nr:YfiR family protein [candidate division Zixibacteria bacterium]
MIFSSVRLSLVIIFLLITAVAQTLAQTAETPADVVTPLLIKLAGFEKNISGNEKDLSVYIMGSPSMYEKFGDKIGTKIGNATIANVMSGVDLPIIQPAILYLGDPSKAEEAIQYTRSKQILSVTGIPDLVSRGITLGIGEGENGKPSVLLNMSSSKEEKLVWNPAILKIAKTIK